MNKRPQFERKYKTVKKLKTAIKAYFDSCWVDVLEHPKTGTPGKVRVRPYTITGLALALGLSRMGLLNYDRRSEYHGVIQAAKLKCQNYAEEYLFDGKNTAGAIFNLKANYNWEDKQTQEITGPKGGPVEYNYAIEFVEPKKTDDNSNS
jgi:hypothetical protein